MRILHVSHFDAANAAWHMSEATKAHTGHDSRTLMGNHTGVAQNADGWLDERGDAAALFAWADVIVWHVGLSDAGRDLGPSAQDIYQGALAQWFSRKPAVFWINGSKTTRDHAAIYRERYADIPLVATTPDLCRMYEAEWIPVCVPEWLDKGDYQRARMSPKDRLHVFHAPTDPSIKNTKDLEESVKPILGSVTVHIASGWPFKRCLAYRTSCDVTFDHMQGYYGASTVEALAFGQPALVHLDATCREYFQRHVGSCPPVIDVTDSKTLRDALLGLANNMASLPTLGAACRRWYVDHFGNAWKAKRWAKWLEKVVGSPP